MAFRRSGTRRLRGSGAGAPEGRSAAHRRVRLSCDPHRPRCVCGVREDPRLIGGDYDMAEQIAALVALGDMDLETIEHLRDVKRRDESPGSCTRDRSRK